VFHAAGSENAGDEFGEAFHDEFPPVLETFREKFIFSRGPD